MRQEEIIYECMRKYINSEDQEKIKVLLETYGVSYFHSFEQYKKGLLFNFTENGLFESIKIIIEAGWDVNELDKDGMNALGYWGDKETSKEIAIYLIEKGIDMNCVEEEYKQNIFSLALGACCFDLAKILYHKGADINWKDEKGRDILYHIKGAVYSNELWEEWVLLLLKDPGRCEGGLLRKLKTERLKLIMN